MTAKSAKAADKRIEKITLQRFRGATIATELVIDRSKPLVIIFGENGTGKSSIIDAVDLICNKSGGSIGDRSSTKADKHQPSIGHQAKDISVEMAIGNATYRGRYSGSKIIVDGPEPIPMAHILRRYQLLRLVEAAPSDRFNMLKKFIDVEGVEKCEQTLRDALKTVGNRLEGLSELNVEAAEALNNLWESEGKRDSSAANALHWAAQKVATDIADTQAKLVDLERLLKRFDEATKARRESKQAESDIEAAETTIARVQAEIDAASGLDTGTSVNLIDILNRVQNYIAALSTGQKPAKG